MRRTVAKKKPPSIEEEIEALVAQADAMRDRADALLDLFADKRRPSGIPRDSMRRLWEAKSLRHCPFTALDVAFKEAQQ
jgi:hypothetical protein